MKVNDPEIISVWVLSTGHLRHETVKKLEGPDAEWTSYDYEEGLWVYVPQRLEEFAAELQAVGEELFELMRTAIGLGVKYIQFDCDGPKHEELPYYEWS